MSYFVDDTIVAIASAPGGALQGILRLSGPQVVSILEACFVGDCDARLSETRLPQSIAGNLHGVDDFGLIPCALYLWTTSRSYTRQPTAEIHTIGSPPMLDACLSRICDCGARLAESGEFTLRAFLAGRIDLTQAEAVLGVIDAESDAQLETALTQLAGGVATQLTEVRDEILDLLAELEAGLDFVEEDIEFISREALEERLLHAQEKTEMVLDQVRTRAQPRADYRVVLRGAPNVGKSSLLNALSNQNAAIVSNERGTTRDFVTTELSLNGLECTLVDTAGVSLGLAGLSPEVVAQQVTEAQIAQADLQLFCVDSTRSLSRWETIEIDRITADRGLVVATKVDELSVDFFSGNKVIYTSSKTLEGLDTLRAEIATALSSDVVGSGVVASTGVRCHESLRVAAKCIARSRCVNAESLGEELIAADLHAALEELGKVVGVIYTDDILDRIFSRFCIGK